MVYDFDQPETSIRGYDKYDITMRWYSSALNLNVNDIQTINHGPHLCITPTHHVPDVPRFDNFIPFSDPWNDKKMKHNELCVFTDGSIYYNDDDKDPRSRIYENSGGAVNIYHNHKLIKSWTFPISTRTNIKTMDVTQFKKTFTIIEDEINQTTCQIKYDS